MKMTPNRQMWLDHLKQCDASGLSMTDYAKKHEIGLKQLYQIKYELRKQGVIDKPKKNTPNQEKSFARVVVKKHDLETKTRNNLCEVELRNGLVFRFDVGVGADQVKSIVVALAGVAT